MRAAIGLIAFLLVVFAVAATGASFSPGAWYAALAKPTWTPPNWLFAPVWSLLYLSIAVAAWLVWKRTGLRPAVFGFYAAQLVFNGLWSWIFFGQQRIGLGLVDIAALWLAILGTIVSFARAVPLAGWILVPCLLWVSFAAALNFSIWRLNG